MIEAAQTAEELNLVDFEARGQFHPMAGALKRGDFVEVGFLNEELSRARGPVVQTAWGRIAWKRGKRYRVELSRPPAFVRSKAQGVLALEIEPRHVRGVEMT